MHDVFNSILPVATLLLGAGLGNFLKLSELRNNQRLDAADQLADLTPLLWNRNDSETWLAMNAAVSRLTIRLNLAGVHPELTVRLQDSAIAFWQSVHVAGQDEQGDVWSVGESAHETWTEVSAVVAELLGTNSQVKRWWIGRRSRRLLKKWDELDRALLASLNNAEN